MGQTEAEINIQVIRDKVPSNFQRGCNTKVERLRRKSRGRTRKE
jgi:hypothetical protein